MHYEGLDTRATLVRGDNGTATPEFCAEGWRSLLGFSAVHLDGRAPNLDGVSPITRWELVHSRSMVELDQLVQELAGICQMAWAAYERAQDLHRIVRPYLSPKTWDEATEIIQRGECSLPTEMTEVSILWLDIASFTELIDNHPLDQVIVALNAYLDTLTRIVYRHGGDVNKYLGDGFLAVFADADAAVQAARELQEAADDFNRLQAVQGRLSFPTRIGMDTGLVVLASLGSCDRQDRTVIGMPVNLAQRLQEQAPSGGIWLSQATFERLRDASGWRALGPVALKGRQEPVVVYEMC